MSATVVGLRRRRKKKMMLMTTTGMSTMVAHVATPRDRAQVQGVSRLFR